MNLISTQSNPHAVVAWKDKIIMGLLIAALLALALPIFSQSGEYDARFVLSGVDCDNQVVFVDIEIKAVSVGSQFNVSDQNYRFSFERAVVPPVDPPITGAPGNPTDRSIYISQQYLTGFILPPSGPPVFYDPQTLVGSTDTVASVNIKLSSPSGFPVPSNEWLPISQVQLDIVDCSSILNLIWQTDEVFPQTFVGEEFLGAFFEAEGRNFEDLSIDLTEFRDKELVCPDNILVDNDPGQCGAIVDFAAQDNCTCGNTINYSQDPGTLFLVGTTTVDATGNDANGENYNCSFTVTVNDVSPPTITCPANIDVEITQGETSAIVNFLATTADNCSTPSISYSQAPGTSFPLGTTIVTATALTSDGLSANCSFDVSVSVQGSLTCPEDIVVLTDPGQCEAVVDFAAIDACGCGNTITYSQDPGTAFTLGTTTVTANGTGTNNENFSCTFDITVNDGDPPLITSCPGDIGVFVNPGSTGAVVTFAATASDNCSTPIITYSQDPGTEFLLGTTPVLVTASDEAGLTTTCSFDVAVTEDQSPFGQYDARFVLRNVDCENKQVYVDIEIKAVSPSAQFNISDQNYRFSFERAVVPPVDPPITGAPGNPTDRSVFISDQYLTGFILPPSGPPVFYDPHTLVGSIDTVVSVNIALSSPSGFPVPSDQWLPISQVRLDVVDCSSILNLIWQTDEVFPQTFVGEEFLGSLFEAEGRLFQDLSLNLQDFALNLQCPSDIIISAAPGSCGAIVDFSADDGCNCASTLTYSQDPGTFFPVGTTTVTATATDANGSAFTCSFDVTVNDDQAPTATCQDVAVQLDATGVANITVNQVDNGSSDACGLSNLSINRAGFGCADIGSNTVTLTATDANGNSNTCTATVTVVDGIAPIVACEDITVALGSNGQATVSAEIIAYQASDNCSPLIFNDAGNVFVATCADVGTARPFSFTVSDASGNQSACTLNANIVDDTPPVIACEDITVALGSSGQATVSAEIIAYQASDNCSPLIFNDAGSVFVASCADVGTARPFSFTVSDASGNQSACTLNANIVDDTPPVIACEDINVALGSNGQATVSAEIIAYQASDNCSPLIFNDAGSVFVATCADVGTSRPFSFTVTDASGNQSACTLNANIVDDTPPNIDCEDITIALGSNGQAVVSAEIIAYQASDNCSPLTFNDAGNVFVATCADVGTSRPFSFTVTDASGNQSSCTLNANIVDDTPPVIACEDINVALGSNGQAVVSAEIIAYQASDNCSPLIFNDAGNVFIATCADVGTSRPFSFTVTDASGNQSACTLNANIVDDTPPNIDCEDITVALGSNGQAVVSAEIIAYQASDNCSPLTFNDAGNVFVATCADVGTSRPFSFTVTDASGNQSACTLNANIVDDTPPNIDCEDITVALGSNGQAVVSAEIIAYQASDNCSPLTFNDAGNAFVATCTDVGISRPFSFTVTDASGNQSSCTLNANIVDDTPPVIACEDITVTLGSNGQATVSAEIIAYQASDNCSPLTFNDAGNVFVATCADVGTARPFSFTVTDRGGNQSACTLNVNIVDDTPPSITCPSNVSVPNDPGQCGTQFSNLPGPTILDNCSTTLTYGLEGNPLGIFSTYGAAGNGVLEDIFILTGSASLTYTATDPSGNEASCSFTLTVTDTQPPVVSCPANMLVNTDAANCGATVSWQHASVEDNCPISIFGNPLPFTYELSGATSAGPVSVDYLNGTNTSAASLNLGVTTVTYNFQDITSTPNSCSFTITVEDNEAPIVSCQDITLDLNPDGTATISSANINSGSSDNCGIESLSLSNSSFSRENIGPNTVVLTATDGSGNSSACSATVTINPVLIAYVWDDQDGDGKQDEGEPALADAPVELIDHSSGAVLQQLLTNADGEAIFSLGDIGATQRLRLKFFEKLDHRFSLKDQGNNDNIDSDPSRSNGLTTSFTLDTDGLTDKWDAGQWAPGDVQAFVWDDQDGDGKQDAGEPGLTGAQVDLLESNGNLIASTTTDGDGLASFSNVPADRALRLKFYELPNLSFTQKDQGNNDNIDSDANRSNGLTGTFQATSGSQTFDKWDAGMLSAATVQAYVWDDQDGDGKQDDTEPGIADARVDLLETDGALIETKQTDANGLATFENVPTDRSVRLQFFEKAGHRFTLKDKGNNDNIDSDASRSNGLTSSFQATAGNQIIDKWDAGLWSPAEVQAFVWDDLDGDGKQDAEEPGIKGVEVHLLETNGDIVQTVNTDDAGLATFAGVPADRAFKLQFLQLTDFEFTLKDQGNNDNIDSDANRSNGMTGTFQASAGNQTFTAWDAGLWSPAQVQAFVWDDLDGDGKQDNNEPGIANAQVDLVEQDGSLISSTTTNSEGIATFTNVPADRNVKLQFYESTDQRFSLKDQGNNDNIDSDASRSSGLTGAFKASTGAQVFDKWDCGLWTQAQVEAFVWNDLDQDGKQDNDELGLEGVIVDLLESNNEVISSTSTNADGLAIFLDVPADRALRLRFQTPTGYSITSKDQGNNDNIDSDANKSNGRTGTFQATMGQQLFTKWDAGLVADNTARVVPSSNLSQAALEDISADRRITVEDINLKAFPNPFSTRTRINFQLPKSAEVSLEIYNLHGQRVHSIAKARLDSGTHQYEWDGSKGSGEPLPTGIYLLRLRVDKKWYTRKLSIIKP